MHVCKGPQTPLAEKRKGRMFSMTDREYGKASETAQKAGMTVNAYVRFMLGVEPETASECHRLACSDPAAFEAWRRERWERRLLAWCGGRNDQFRFMAEFGPDFPLPRSDEMFRRRARANGSPPEGLTEKAAAEAAEMREVLVRQATERQKVLTAAVPTPP